jgi:homotetrameric cytidine deaminase
MIKAIIFDMDGVLVDSEIYIAKAIGLYFEKLGIKIKESDHTQNIGTGEAEIIKMVGSRHNLEIDVEQAKIDSYKIYGELVKKMGITVGSRRFIENAKKAGMKMGIATSADRFKLNINLKAANLDPDDFAVILSGDQVERRKPSPDIYLLAAEKMGLENKEALVFEDATLGVIAALRANSSCVGITTSFSKEELINSGADFAFESLDQFEDFSTIEEFNQLLLKYRAKEKATQTRLNAYTPFSEFKVGAALVSKKTKVIYSGCNVENSSYGATICAERSAILASVAKEGSLEIEQLVVVAQPIAVPCAICLQVIAEFATPETLIHLYDTKGAGKSYTFGQLLPHPFYFKK